MNRNALVAACAGLLLLLSACGGGGRGGASGDTTGGGSTGGGGSATITGLIPAAPAAGATLYADAAVLLPLRAGAVWHYRGTTQATGGTGTYGVLVTQSAGSAGGVSVQRQSTAPDDDDTSTYTLSGGAITVTESLRLAPSGPLETLSYALLRSPVRQSEQVTVVDRPGVAVSGDIDGDGVNDTADFAVYSRIVGNEAVELPDIQRTVTALRVDATFLVRFKKSSDGQFLPLGTFTQSEWYMPGVGLVRRTGVAPADNGSPTQFDERLVFWDGLTEGMGALLPKKVSATAGGFALGQPWSAVRLGDRALVATALDLRSGANLDEGLVLSALDGRGAVVGSRSYPALRPGDVPLPLLPLAGGAVGLLTPEPGNYIDPYETINIRMRRFDRDAAPLGDADGMVVLSGALVGSAAAASDGEKLWLLWVDADAASRSTRLWLRDFNANGQPVGAARLLASTPFQGDRRSRFSRLALAAAPGRVLATWADGATSPIIPQAHLALVVGTGPAQVRFLGTLSGPSYSDLQPVVSAERQSLSWIGLVGFDGFSNSDDRLRRGLAVADDGTLRRTATVTLDNEVLATTPGSFSTAMYEGIAFADGTGFVTALALNGLALPGVDVFEAPYLQLNRWVGNGPLAATMPQAARLRLAYVGFHTGQALGTVRYVVPFDDRLLVLGHDPIGLGASVVFSR